MEESKRAGTLVPKTRLLDRYEIVGILGRGGMSTVYKARDLHFPNVPRWVAIKEMTVAVPREREQVFRTFEREAHLLAQLRHPSIPIVYDYFTIGDRAYLVLELVEGKTLETILRETKGFIPEPRVLRWAIQLCDVLDYLHTRPKPIIFRDLKPSNIMITPEDRVMLIDFGIARIFDPKTRGTIIGTEGYAPPEQYRGVISPLVDIYALGATLHHILSGQDPRKEPPFSFAERPIRKYNPNVSPELEAIVYKALAYRPEQRFQSAREMKAALEALYRKKYGDPNQPVDPASQPASPSEGTQTLPTRTLTTQTLPTQTLPTQTLPTQTLPTQTLPTQQLGGDTTSLSTTTLPPDTQAPVAGAQTAPQPLWVFEAEDEIRATATVQGARLFFGSYDHNVYALRIHDGQMEWKFPTQGGVVTRPAVAGNILFFGSEDGGIYALRPESGQMRWRIETPAPVRSSPRLWKQLLFIGADDGHLYAIHAEQGRILWKFNAGAPIRSTPWVTGSRVFFGTEAGEIFSLDHRGKEIWRYQANHPFTGSPVAGDGIIYIAGRDGMVYALDADSGWVLWRYRMGRGTVATPTVHENRVYIGAADGVLYCLHAKRGKLIWQFQSKHQIAGSALILGDRLYIGATDHHLYCLRLQDGSPLWAFAVGGPITATPVTDEQGRMLFIGAFDRRMYALPLEAGPSG